jgi:predicted DNA-binding WGR domain protein
MDNYMVKISSVPKGHTVPALLKDVGAWLKEQPRGSLGWFDGFKTEAISKHWDPANAPRLQKSGFVFLTLGEGSMLCLLTTGEKSPPAVVLLGSEGDRGTVADSLEELLLLWSKGETEVVDLDEDDDDVPSKRAALAQWLKQKKVSAPKTPSFDFQAWLDGHGMGDAKTTEAARPTALKRKPTVWMKKLGPKAQTLASLLGRPVDDPEVMNYVTKVFGRKLPQATSEMNDEVCVDNKNVYITVTHEILNDAYPPIRKSAKSFIPYLAEVDLEKFDEPVLGVSSNITQEDLQALLGKPTLWDGHEEKSWPVWTYPLDEGAQTELTIWWAHTRVGIRLGVRHGEELDRYRRIPASIFIAWAATKGLLNSSAMGRHADLFDAVAKRKASGTDLFDALGRGLWDTHLRDDRALRAFARHWFLNLGQFEPKKQWKWITTDLIKVFGKRVGPHDHDEPKVDEASWAAVDKAAPIFAERFEPWLNKRGSKDSKAKESSSAGTKKTPSAKKTEAPVIASKPKAKPAAPGGARYFEFIEGASAKFWEIRVQGRTFSTRYGKIGTDGQSTDKTYESEQKAQAESNKLIGEKTKKGYREKSAPRRG